jgi:hypothetical protein
MLLIHFSSVVQMKDFQIYEEFCSKQREAFDTIRQLKAENRNFDVFLEVPDKHCHFLLK